MPTWNPTTQSYVNGPAPTDSAGDISDRATLMSRRASSRAVHGAEAETINVRAYSINGDGTDEYAKIQLLLDNVRTASQKRRRLMFPEPENGVEYKVSSPLNPAVGYLTLEGTRREGVTITQTTADTPVFLWNDDHSPDGTPAIRIAHLSLKNSNIPTASTTQQYGIQFRSNASGSLASGSGYMHMAVEDVAVHNAYVGIGNYATGTGTSPIWSSSFRNIRFSNVMHHAVKFTGEPGTGVIGQPHLTFDHIDVLNYDPQEVTNDNAPAIKIVGGTGVVMNSMNVEEWRNQQLYLSGGSYGVINGWRTERCELLVTDNILYLASGQYVLNGVDMQNLYVKHPSGTMRLIRADAGAEVEVNGFRASRSATGSTTSGTVGMIWAASTTKVYADGIVPGTGVSGYLPSAYGDGQYGIVRYNGMDPAWDVLPTAAVGYRGRRARVEGGVGGKDQVVVCVKDAANAYLWHPVY